MRREIALGAIIAIGALSMTVGALQTLSQGALKATGIQKVKDNLYIITGSDASNRDTFSGGNTGVFITDKGVVVVDTKLAGWGQVILDRIKTVTDKPVVTIINTHTHGDHTGSNEFFPPSVEIVTHENTKANMEKMDAFKGKASALPDRTYKDKLSLGSGKDQVDLYYFGPGHTNGDSFIVYPALRVMQAGDMFAWKDAPFLDRSNGGSGVEFPRTLAKAVAAFKSNVDTVIPGHSPLMALKDLDEYQRFNADLLAAVQDAIKAGKTADDAVGSINLTSKYPGYKSERLKAAVQAIYGELKR